MYSLSEGEGDDINLQEINYGQYKAEYNFKIGTERTPVTYKDIQSFGENFLLEIMRPEYFAEYLDIFTHIIENLDKTLLTGWGEDWN